MWAKDTYQEQILGYLGEVETEIEQLAYSRLSQHDLRDLYIDLDIVTKRLWRLIGATDVDWEGLRYPLETGFDQLQRAFYSVPPAGVLMMPAGVMLAERYERRVELWETVDMLG
jgi:hypothetical protein